MPNEQPEVGARAESSHLRQGARPGTTFLECEAVVDGKEPTQTVNLSPSGQAGSSPANGTVHTCQRQNQETCDACATMIGKLEDEARFDERVACAALVLQEFSEIPGNMANRSVLIEMASNVAKAILARGNVG